MNGWHSFAVAVLLQVTAITLGGAIAMAIVRRRAALQHGIGVLTLAFALASPALTLLLPRPAWLDGVLQSGVVQNGTPQSDTLQNQAIQVSDDSLAASVHRSDEIVRQGHQVSEDTVDAGFAQSDSMPGESIDPQLATAVNGSPGRWATFAGADRTIWIGRGFTLALWIWAAGAVGFCLRFISVQRKLRSLAASVQHGSIDRWAVEEARRALRFTSLPPVGISELAPMPLVLGCWRPLVVLPRRLVESASPARVRDVLIHEFAHIARRDPWINLAQQFAQVVFWPHPGVHWVNRQIALAREEVCDNFVLTRANAAEFAQTLLEVAEYCGGARFALSLLGIFSRRWSLEKRISGILDPERITSTRADRKLLAAVTLLLTAACVFVGGVGALAENSKAPNVPPVPEPSATSEPQAAVQIVPATGVEKTRVDGLEVDRSENKAAATTKKITVHGVCRDQNSKPVPRILARVFRRAYNGDPPKLLGEVRSKDDGRFSISDVEIDSGDDRTRGQAPLILAVTSPGYASACMRIDEGAAREELKLVMSSDPGKLSGLVADSQGRPIQGVQVFTLAFGTQFVPGFQSAVTDEQGHYTIVDVDRWKNDDEKSISPQGLEVTTHTECYVLLQHPGYATTRAAYSRIPQVVKVTLTAPAVIEGHVIDRVTGKPLANVVVSAQGVARGDWIQTRTDQAGNYRLRTNKDHFNIWAEADDRIAVAVKAIAAVPEKTVKDADIRMVRGGYVVGTVIDSSTGKPFKPLRDDPSYTVAHYGPARPMTGAAVTWTPINFDGTYRLRVAPGRNWVYSMMDGATSAIVNVEDGQEVRLDLRTGEKFPHPINDDDLNLRSRLVREAIEEDAEQARKASGAVAPPKPPKRQRPDTPVGHLLDKLEEQNTNDALFHDPWLSTLKAIIDIGPEAVPEIISELDTATGDRMLRCCGFMLRAIGDKRAVPALIRAIPRTLFPMGSDMGLRSDDADLAKWTQQHDLNERPSSGNEYDFGRPVREIFGALHKLTGQTMGEQELNFMSLGGVESQRQMKQELFYREAKRWAGWWDQHAAEFTQDPAYAHVNLPPPAVAAVAKAPQAGAHFRVRSRHSNSQLTSVFNSTADQTFYDLDTGRVAGLPQKWRGSKNIEPLLDEIAAWAAGEGYDLMGTETTADDGQRYYALLGIGLKAWELDAKRWKSTPGDITVEGLQAEGSPSKGLLLHFDADKQAIDPRATAPFFYITREGTPGLLFVGIEVKDDSLKPGMKHGAARPADHELDPIDFNKGRRFGYSEFEEVK